MASCEPNFKKVTQAAEAQTELVTRELLATQERVREKDQRKHILELKLSEMRRTLVILRRKNRSLTSALRSDLDKTFTGATAFLTATAEDSLSRTMA